MVDQRKVLQGRLMRKKRKGEHGRSRSLPLHVDHSEEETVKIAQMLTKEECRSEPIDLVHRSNCRAKSTQKHRSIVWFDGTLTNMSSSTHKTKTAFFTTTVRCFTQVTIIRLRKKTKREQTSDKTSICDVTKYYKIWKCMSQDIESLP